MTHWFYACYVAPFSLLHLALHWFILQFIRKHRYGLTFFFFLGYLWRLKPAAIQIVHAAPITEYPPARVAFILIASSHYDLRVPPSEEIASFFGRENSFRNFSIVPAVDYAFVMRKYHLIS